MSNPRPPRPRGAAHRPSFAKIERALPAPGSEQAEVLHHVFHCETCTEAALHILRMGLGKPFSTRSRYNYERVFEAVEVRREEILDKLGRASDLWKQVAQLPEEDAKKHVQALARVEPWVVASALLEVARQLLVSTPERAAVAAELAVVAAEELDPAEHPVALRSGLLAHAYVLVAAGRRRAGQTAEAEGAFAKAEDLLAESSEVEPPSAHLRQLFRLRKLQRALDRTVDLLEERIGDLDV